MYGVSKANKISYLGKCACHASACKDGHLVERDGGSGT
jgi:hypothetical protein